MRTHAACWRRDIRLEECTICEPLVHPFSLFPSLGGHCLHVLATEGSMRGGAPRPGLVAMAVVNRSGSSNPAEGGGDGIAATGAVEEGQL